MSPRRLAPPTHALTMTAQEVAELLRVDRKTVYEAAARGRIPSVHLGRRLLFSREDIERWLSPGSRPVRTHSSPRKAEPRSSAAPRTVGGLTEVGDRGWVAPTAIVEELSTGELFVDPDYTARPECSRHRCIELAMTAEGLVATGSLGRHCYCDDVTRDHLRPVVDFEHRAETL